MAEKVEFIYKTISPLNGGLNTALAGDMIKDDESPVSKNVGYVEGTLQADTGYITFGGTLTGYPQLAVQLFYKNATSDLILITTSRCYKWANSEWQLVPGSVYTTLAANASQGDSTIDVNDDTGFADGDNITVKLDNGGQHVTTVNGSPTTNTITLTDNMPSAATSGNGVGEPVELSGKLDNQVNFVQWVAGDILIVTNNNDPVKQFDGTQLTDLSNLPSGGSTFAANVAVFNEYLMLFNTTEGGTQYPQRVRWSGTGDITNWSTGNASYEDLYDDEDFIQAPLSLGPYMYIYRERSIYRISYMGSSELLFEFEKMVSGEGAVSTQAVADVGDYHLFFGNANLYKYSGDFGITPVGDNIYYEIFSTSGIFNPAYQDRTFGVYIEELDEVWFFFPSTGSEVPDKLIRFNLVADSIFIREPTHKMLGYGFYVTTNAKTWNDLEGSWEEQGWTWDSKRVTANSPVTLLCGYSPKQVYSYNYMAITDNGTDIAWYYDTKDFTAPSEKLRFDLLEFEAKGPTIRILYSLDGGNSYTQIESKTMGTSYTKHRIWNQMVTDQIRFRFEGDSSGFKIKRIKMKFREESFW